jgi:hypothetical protein
MTYCVISFKNSVFKAYTVLYYRRNAIFTFVRRACYTFESKKEELHGIKTLYHVILLGGFNQEAYTNDEIVNM